MELLYFDHDHGVERLLFVRMDRASQRVHFRLEKGPDSTHDEDSEDVSTETLNGSTQCSSLAQFFGFCQALVEVMRETPFLLQDPGKAPFAAMPQEALVLADVEDGVAPEELSCRIPAEIADELVDVNRLPARLRPLVGDRD